VPIAQFVVGIAGPLAASSGAIRSQFVMKYCFLYVLL
jgi:hypothetical protein